MTKDLDIMSDIGDILAFHKRKLAPTGDSAAAKAIKTASAAEVTEQLPEIASTEIVQVPESQPPPGPSQETKEQRAAEELAKNWGINGVPIGSEKLTPEQEQRAVAWRRSQFNKIMVGNLVSRYMEKDKKGFKPPKEGTSIAIATLAKMFVGDLVEGAVKVAEERGEAGRALLPTYYQESYRRLTLERAVPAPSKETGDHSALSTTPALVYKSKHEEYI